MGKFPTTIFRHPLSQFVRLRTDGKYSEVSSIYMNGESCYRFEKVRMESGPTPCLEGIVDAVYLLTVDGSSRLKECLRRLNAQPLLSTVRVQHNRTFKNCPKPGVHSPDQDLRHAMSHCFRQALRRGEKRIVTLEDDCEFVGDPSTMRSVVRLFYDVDGGHAFQLGSIPMLATPYGTHMYRIHMGGAAHCVAWTREGMRLFLRRITPYVGREFVDILMTTRLRTFASKRPLAVQAHPMTDNAKDWLTGLDYILHRHVFRSHLDGRFFYATTHAVGAMGGTRMVAVWLSLLVSLVICFMLWRRPRPALSSGRESPQR